MDAGEAQALLGSWTLSQGLLLGPGSVQKSRRQQNLSAAISSPRDIASLSQALACSVLHSGREKRHLIVTAALARAHGSWSPPAAPAGSAARPPELCLWVLFLEDPFIT